MITGVVLIQSCGRASSGSLVTWVVEVVENLSSSGTKTLFSSTFASVKTEKSSSGTLLTEVR